MRDSLLDLISKTIIHRYDLPNESAGLNKTIFSLENDRCLTSTNNNDLTEIIFNSIVEYSFNEFEISGKNFNNLQRQALMTRLKYNPDADESTQIKYGFLGEVVLFAVLYVLFRAKPLIARGYFYNPLEKSETKGYDSYHLIESRERTELWFGEVKFHRDYKSGLNDALSKIDKALSDEYLSANVLAFDNQINNLNIRGSRVESVLEDWRSDPSIRIIDELRQHNMKLVYPIMLLYEKDECGFDRSIQNVIDYIESNHTAKVFTLNIEFSVFFVLLPLKDVINIKKEVLQWIASEKPLMS